MLKISPTFAQSLPQGDPFSVIMNLTGKVYRQQQNRCTFEYQVESQRYFIKLHFGVGWWAIFKDLLRLRRPIIDATPEWLALKRLQEMNVGVPEPIAYGYRGINPARRQSFIVTQALENTLSVNEIIADKSSQTIDFPLRVKLIGLIAETTALIHQHGINHRDYYLCHFLVPWPLSQENIKLYVLDWHRAQCRKKLPTRWQIKDLAALYFSALEGRITTRDVLRFVAIYGDGLRKSLTEKRSFWLKVVRRGHQIYRREYRREPPKLL